MYANQVENQIAPIERRSFLLGASKHWWKIALSLSTFSFILFTGAEALSWRLFGGWKCVDAVSWEDVTGYALLEHAAVYLFIPEVFLGVSAWSFYRKSLIFSSMPPKLLVSAFMATVYTILALLSYNILDRIFLAGVR